MVLLCVAVKRWKLLDWLDWKCRLRSVTSLDEPQQRWEWKCMCEIWHRQCPGFGSPGCCTSDMQQGLKFYRFRFKVCIETDLNSCVLSVIAPSYDTGDWCLGLCSEDVRECMLVAPPTEWACVVLWLIPPLQRLDGIQHTNTLDWIHHAGRASAQNWNM